MNKQELVKPKLIHLKTLLDNERDMQLDMIKVKARSDDQANSACNLVKQLYSYFYFVSEHEVIAYITRSNDSANDIDFSDEDERKRISKLIFNEYFDSDENHNINDSEKEFLEPFSKYKLNKWLNIISGLVGLYGNKWNTDTGSFQVINGIKLMKNDLDKMNNGYNPYN